MRVLTISSPFPRGRAFGLGRQSMLRIFGTTYVSEGTLGGSIKKSYIVDREFVELSGEADLSSVIEGLLGSYEEHEEVTFWRERTSYM